MDDIAIANINYGFFSAVMVTSLAFWYASIRPASRRQHVAIVLPVFAMSVGTAIAAGSDAARLWVFFAFAGWHIAFAIVQLATMQDLDDIARRLD